MPRVCSACGTEAPDDATFCPMCGRAMAASGGSTGRGVPETLVAALCYVTIIPAIVFLLIEPYKRNSFVRFHAFQSIFFYVATFIASILVRIVFWILDFIPLLGHLAVLLLGMLLPLGWIILCLLLVVKAVQHERFALPYLGELAERQATPATAG